MKLTPLDIKLTDSQFFELKKYTALQIAAAFGVKPNQINNYDKSSYSNSEMQQLSFYVDTELFDCAAPLTVSLKICCTGSPVIPSNENEVLKCITSSVLNQSC